jgi:hypothetical protein
LLALNPDTDVLRNSSFSEKDRSRLRLPRLAIPRDRRDSAEAIAGMVFPRILHDQAHPSGHTTPTRPGRWGASPGTKWSRSTRLTSGPNNASSIVVGNATLHAIATLVRDRTVVAWSNR